MKLKTKLWISFACIVLLPLTLTLLLVVGLFSYQLKVIDREYNIESQISDIFPNTTRLFSRLIVKAQDTISKELLANPQALQDDESLELLDEKITNESISMIVRIGGEIIYESDGVSADMLIYLPEEGGYATEDGTSSQYVGDEEAYLINAQEFKGSGDEPVTVFIVIRLDSWIPEIKAMLIQTGVAIVLILILTALVFTLWIYRSILQPLQILKDSTIKIKEGNLDFHIQANEKDELGQLCVGFEEMRQRLKESAETRILFDAESKELISNISHVLKTPITAIKGYVEGLMDGVADTPEKRDRYIRTIYNKANDMDRLIEELTFYSKIDTNRIPYNFSKIAIHAFFNDCSEEMGLDLEAKNVDFSYYNYCDDSAVVIADVEQLKRVINNILSNSIKYFDKAHGKINMRIKDVGDFIQVEIEDNGKGIAQKDLSNVFDRFYRTDSSRNSATGGSGIGLSIVKKIIEDHGGRIWASSKEGTGTVMYFVLRKYQEVPNE